MKIAGFCSSHDCSYCILEDGKLIIHNELERFTREKEPMGDGIQFMFDTEKDINDITHFTHCFDTWNGGIVERFPETFKQMSNMVQNNGGNYFVPGHHMSHAANAFFSSNYDEALIFTLDGGGRDYGPNGEMIITAFTVWEGKGNKITEVDITNFGDINIGSMWSTSTSSIFGLSNGYPKGSQNGTVMAMACLGDPKYSDAFLKALSNRNNLDFEYFKKIAQKSEQDTFDVAASLQLATEIFTKNLLSKYIKAFPKYKNLCLAGGVVLNSVMVGKIYEWFPQIENIYIPPVPYDAGLAIGSAQYVWHHILDNPRIQWDKNITPYLGRCYNKDEILKSLKEKNAEIKYRKVDDDEVVDLLSKGDNVISIFNGGSESGRRALGNRSILCDPRNPEMKDILNKKVKYRQWFRPFAPSILREEVSNWFERDVSSPYMTKVIQFKSDCIDKVPAVVHYDNSARLQTVEKKDNPWYYSFIEKFFNKTGVPIILNTSFNDREPIVETPEHAINCFLKTNIDYLYFPEYKILVEKV